MKGWLIDLSGICVSLAALGVSLLYPNMIRGWKIVTLVSGILICVFLFLFIQDRKRKRKVQGEHQTEVETITEIVLLNEEDMTLMVWDMYGKISLVIGRDIKENQVDIDLGQSPYASMVDIEHAVLNYSSGSWYVEDLGSANGIRIKKSEDGRVYKLSSDTPCRLEKGDCLYVGLNRLLFR